MIYNDFPGDALLLTFANCALHDLIILNTSPRSSIELPVNLAKLFYLTVLTHLLTLLVNSKYFELSKRV